MLPPHDMTIASISREEGISVHTLYYWRDKAKQAGHPVPGKVLNTDNWSAESKLAVVIETAIMTESQLNQYCREKVHR